jgi:hypothetical protein
MDAAIAEVGFGNEWEVAAELTPQQIQHIWSWFLLPQTTRLALTRFAVDLANGANPAEAIRALLTLLPPTIPMREYYPAYMELNDRLGSWEPAPADAEGEITGPVPWNPAVPIAELDEAGLRATVRDASLALRALPTVDFAELTGASARDVAEATVDFERLVCHLERNWMHYNHAIWASESFEQRIERLSIAGLAAGLIENRIIGFQGQSAAFPLADLSAVPEVDLTTLIADLAKTIAGYQAESVLISVPSSGQVLEATVGECDACEEYVHESRAFDLRLQEAGARQAKAEADRREARVQAGDYGDPAPQSTPIVVDLRMTQQPGT